MLARFPRLGEVKTRIAAELGDEETLRLHKRMVSHCLRRALALKATGEASVEVRTDASFQGAARDWLGRGPVYRYQGGGDLGAKLRAAFNDGFRSRAERVVVIGSDCPRLTTDHLRRALHLLASRDVVVGPAVDGGYYLIGLTRAAAISSRPRLFSDIPWGSDRVLERTIELVEAAGFSYSLLDPLPDVDRPKDVADAEAALAADVVGRGSRVSVVIPALEEEECVARAVSSAIGAGAAEVIVMDGGSRDATRQIAAGAGARVIDAPAGRATQMDAGAAEATGEVLLFLHADTELPRDAMSLILEALAGEDVVAGSFGFSVGPDGWRHRLISAVGRMRSEGAGHPYGDQGLFMSAATYRDLGGFPDLPVMEDYEMVRRLRRLGGVKVLDAQVRTSARAWDRWGLVRPTFINLAVIAGYRLGVRPERLATWRRSLRERPPTPG